MRERSLIKTRERIVRYSMVDFIKAVESRPMLWQRYHTDYHNRDKREVTWHEVATSLYSKFGALSTADKHKTVVGLTKRWKNTRDSFLRSLRRSRTPKDKNDERPIRAYIYEKEMSFLLHFRDRQNDENDNDTGTDENSEADTNPQTATKTKHKDHIKKEADDDVDDVEDNGGGGGDNDYDDEDNDDFDADASNAPSKKKRRLEEKSTLRFAKPLPPIPCDHSDSDAVVMAPKTVSLDNHREHSETTITSKVPRSASTSAAVKEICKERASTTSTKTSKLNEKPNTAEFDPDQSFFDSIKPVIRKMSMDQKLDFQINILKLLKDFRSK